MAFATSNVQKNYFGNLKVTRGAWSGSVGDAPGTIGVEGGQVYLAEFNAQQTGTQLIRVPISVSTSGSVTTVTVYNDATVTSGNFIIIHA